MMQDSPIVLPTKTIEVEQIFLLLPVIEITFTFTLLLTSDLFVVRNGELESDHVVCLNDKVE